MRNLIAGFLVGLMIAGMTPFVVTFYDGKLSQFKQKYSLASLTGAAENVTVSYDEYSEPLRPRPLPRIQAGRGQVLPGY